MRYTGGTYKYGHIHWVSEGNTVTFTIETVFKRSNPTAYFAGTALDGFAQVSGIGRFAPSPSQPSRRDADSLADGHAFDVFESCCCPPGIADAAPIFPTDRSIRKRFPMPCLFVPFRLIHRKRIDEERILTRR
jgi:hypothetical protein